MWPFVKELEELGNYFPDLKDNILPEREFMWSIVSTIVPGVANSLLEDVRKTRTKGTEENK